MDLIILAVTVALSLYGFQNYSFLDKAMFKPYEIKKNNEWWRWISSGFIHKDYTHLIVNMLSYYFFAKYVLRYFNMVLGDIGPLVFVLYYLAAILMSGMYSYYKHQNDFTYAALGASGAVSAIIFSTILIAPLSKITIFFALPMPAWMFGIIYLFYEYSMSKRQMDNIGHDAHFFGAVFGFVFPILLYPKAIINFIENFISL